MTEADAQQRKLDRFVERVERFLVKADMSARRFGILAMNDAAFVSGLRGGRKVKAETIDRCTIFMKSYGPEKIDSRASSARSCLV